MKPPAPGSSAARRPMLSVPPPASDESAAEVLAEKLAAELSDRWRNGERPRAEEYFARHPELLREPTAAAELIYEEVCVRQEHGDRSAAADALRRFPQWREPLEVLFRVHQLVDRNSKAPTFPAVGESLNEFVLLAELGRGARGRVFLAAQRSLADRPVVLKVTPRDGDEHVSLARLQHTNIVPLHSIGEDAARDLRVLCMPYFRGATLAAVLEGLRPTPPARRTGRRLLEQVDGAALPGTAIAAGSRNPSPGPSPLRGGEQAGDGSWQAGDSRSLATPSLSGKGAGGVGNAPPTPAPRSPDRAYLDAAAYDHAVGFLGAQLADALQYAHDRGLVHLDVKPSNVLVTADAQAMLLDFHLARPPVRPDEPPPDWVGGTLAYMSPEQRAAYEAVRAGNPVPGPVDGRSDIYSLGLVLYEALGGPVPPPDTGPPPRLDHVNRRVSVGLADVIHKCLAADPAARYQRACDLAADLHNHLDDLPLCGVRNRCWRERWAKWRRRSPHRVAQLTTAVAVLLAVAGTTAAVLVYHEDQAAKARQRLDRGVELREQGKFAEAVRTLAEGRDVARRLPFHRTLNAQLAEQLEQTRQRAAVEERRAALTREADELHRFMNRVRFLYGSAAPPGRGLEPAVDRCREWWGRRDRFGDDSLTPEVREQVRRDLLDLAILWADLRTAAGDEPAAALGVFAEAERRFGPSPVLAHERRRYTGLPAASPAEPRTAWEFYALGRSHLRDGDLDAAATALRQAVALEPQGLWPNFYAGVCAFRLGRYEEAVAAFTACVSLAPTSPECYYNRGLAHDRLKRLDRAADDYTAALRLAPGLGAAALNRGILHYHAGRHAAAADDFRYALAHGSDPGPAHFNLALVHHARGERDAAVRELEAAARHLPRPAAARELLDRLRSGP